MKLNKDLLNKSDIESILEPTLLWENSSPNSSYTATGVSNLITFNDTITKYAYIVIAFKLSSAQGNATQYMKAKVVVGDYYYLYIIDTMSTQNKTRYFNLSSSTQGYFSDGYEDTTGKNEKCIPIAIYGTNIL
jgi:hypothetical protein